MDLFNSNPIIKVLPYDGDVNYYGTIFNIEEAQDYFNILLNTISWESDNMIIFGKLIVTKRKVAWYGDTSFNYTYSNTIKSALLWTKELLEIKERIETITGETFNSCLLNLYHSGAEGMGWHSDNEKDLKKAGAIASLSFGAARKFVFKHKIKKQTIPFLLENGSLLVMKGLTQTHWLHRLPPTKKVMHARINLTFRTIEY